MTVALEIIEHLHNLWAFERFWADMQSQAGIFYFPPHIESIYSRLLFLRTRQFLMFQDYRKPFGHINPMTASELKTIFDRYRLQKLVKAFPCQMPGRGTLRHRLGMVACWIVRPFAKGDKEGFILMYLLRKRGDDSEGTIT